ncbi:unnamed protein product [Diplocarpon coronariae]
MDKSLSGDFAPSGVWRMSEPGERIRETLVYLFPLVRAGTKPLHAVLLGTCSFTAGHTNTR